MVLKWVSMNLHCHMKVRLPERKHWQCVREITPYEKRHNKAFVSSLDISMPRAYIGRQAHSQFPMISQWSYLKLRKRNSYFRPLSRPPGLGNINSINPRPRLYEIPGGPFSRPNAGLARKRGPCFSSAGAAGSIRGTHTAAFIQLVLSVGFWSSLRLLRR